MASSDPSKAGVPEAGVAEAGVAKAGVTETSMHGKLATYLRRLQWTILRPLASRLGGDERSLLLGPGMEIDELREYEPGDDVRQIDWNMMARLGRPYVRRSQVTRALDVWMLVDVSASLDWGTAQCLKRERALDFLAVTAQIFLRHQHHVGALLFANQPLATVPPSAGSQHLLRLLQAISSPAVNSPVVTGPAVYGRGTDLKAALERAERILPRRSFVILLSDFLVPDGWQAVLRRLVQRHEMVAVCLRDPRESDLPDVGVITLEDPETGRQLVVDTASPGASPRASINLVAGARVLAYIRGREYVLPQDVAALAPDVLRHRLVMSYEGLADGVSPEAVISELLQRYPPPRIDLRDRYTNK